MRFAVPNAVIVVTLKKLDRRSGTCLKILLTAEAHANMPALAVVLDQANYDKVLFMRDAVDYGPFPFEVKNGFTWVVW
jgi:hypothetical protein